MLTGEIVLVGLGLHDDKGISLRGLEEVKGADVVFIELYTSLLPEFSLSRLERAAGKTFHVVSRRELEEENGEAVLKVAERGKAVLLVPGDPLIATTHVVLRLEGAKRGIGTRVVHGASVLSAVIGLSGLHNYKFGKSVTIPFQDETFVQTPYEVVARNRQFGLHTLCLLDIRADGKQYMSIREGLQFLSKIEKKLKQKVVAENTLAVGIARAGSEKPAVKAGTVKELTNYDFGGPPHTLVFPGKLHFMEAEALVVLAGASSNLKEMCE
jgi:diphthine synthase